MLKNVGSNYLHYDPTDSHYSIVLRAGLPATLVGVIADHPRQAGGGGESGINTVESKFLADIILPNGGTVGQ